MKIRTILAAAVMAAVSFSATAKSEAESDDYKNVPDRAQKMDFLAKNVPPGKMTNDNTRSCVRICMEAPTFNACKRLLNLTGCYKPPVSN